MISVQTTTVAAIGVGIDTSRYGHHVTFLRDDLQPATKPIAITETREGYHQLLSTLQDLKRRHPRAVFQIRLDEASLYAVNLRTFLYTLPFEKTISIGDCIRNKNYRVAHFPKRKSDSVDSLSLARYAVLEQPAPTERVPVELCALRDIASRLEAQTREVTRHLNQLHNVLSRVFPEFDTIVRELNAKSILELLKKNPTPDRIARARLDSIKAIPHLRVKTACGLHEAAKETIASLKGPVAEMMVGTLVDQVRYARKLKGQYEQLLVDTYRSLPTTNLLDSIPGIGEVTAAVLTAKIISIERFDRPEQLVAILASFPRRNRRASARMACRIPDARHACRRRATTWSATTCSPLRCRPLSTTRPCAPCTSGSEPEARRARLPWGISCGSSCIWCLPCGNRASPSTLNTTLGTRRRKTKKPRATNRNQVLISKWSPRLQPKR